MAELTNYDRKVSVLAEKYGIPVEKIYSYAADDRIKISVKTAECKVFMERVFLTMDCNQYLEILDKFEEDGRPYITEENEVSVHDLVVDSSTFMSIDAGAKNPEIKFAQVHYEDNVYLAFRAINEEYDLMFNDCVFFLKDDQIELLEKVLGLNEVDYIDINVKETKSSKKPTILERRMIEFESFIKQDGIDITGMKVGDVVTLIKDELARAPGKILTKDLWTKSDSSLESFVKDYCSKTGKKLPIGRPPGL